jgi:endonuclease/exonuclease/phosphatase (EEP) superfamily protein YafD
MFSRYAFSTGVVRTNWKTPRLISARFGQELGNLTLLGVHMLRFPHSRNQLMQVRALAAALEPIKGPKIVMGDFNATIYSNALQNFQGLTGLARHSGLPSWPSTLRLPQIGIDHIFASRDITGLSAVRIGRYAGSDHYSVDVKLAVPVR